MQKGKIPFGIPQWDLHFGNSGNEKSLGRRRIENLYLVFQNIDAVGSLVNVTVEQSLLVKLCE